MRDVIKNIPKVQRRTDNSGDWPFDTDELIRQLLRGEITLDDPILQATLLDWIESEDYNKFITAMRSLGYMFESRELVAADYGAPTTRKRWYAIFRRDGRDIVWPDATHHKDAEPKWLQCGDFIDWSDLGTSIFDRRKPLAEATQKRIANGIRKYIVDNPEPYIIHREG